jgi:hypothetical protein
MKFLVIGIKEHRDAPQLAGDIRDQIIEKINKPHAGVRAVEVEVVDLQAGLNSEQLERVGSDIY